jgi:hypothetical protein
VTTNLKPDTDIEQYWTILTFVVWFNKQSKTNEQFCSLLVDQGKEI